MKTKEVELTSGKLQEEFRNDILKINHEQSKLALEKTNYENTKWIRKLFQGFKTEGGLSHKQLTEQINDEREKAAVKKQDIKSLE